MVKRSIRASPTGIQLAKRGFAIKGWTQENLAGEVNLKTRQPIWRFFTGQSVDRQIFIEICSILDLDWREIALDPPAEFPGMGKTPRFHAYCDDSTCATEACLAILYSSYFQTSSKSDIFINLQQMINNNWKNFIKNLGEWQGSKTQISPTGKLIDSTLSISNVEGIEKEQIATVKVRQYQDSYAELPIAWNEEKYHTLGKSIFFDTGAFSEGTIQILPKALSAAHHGFMTATRRLQFTHTFDPAGDLLQLVLIRECRSGADTPERPPLTVEQLYGVWEGTAVTAYADLSSPKTQVTKLAISKIGIDRLEQVLLVGDTQISSIARIGNNILHFEAGEVPHDTLLLPDGGSSNVPVQIQPHQPSFIEVGWLVSDNNRQRLIRNYNDKGEWISSTHIIEQRLSEIAT
jgi:transcriptional regulator with XRE-family HTH domain